MGGSLAPNMCYFGPSVEVVGVLRPPERCTADQGVEPGASDQVRRPAMGRQPVTIRSSPRPLKSRYGGCDGKLGAGRGKRGSHGKSALSSDVRRPRADETLYTMPASSRQGFLGLNVLKHSGNVPKRRVVNALIGRGAAYADRTTRAEQQPPTAHADPLVLRRVGGTGGPRR